MTACFPLALTDEQIGGALYHDYNPLITIVYVNPVNNKNVSVGVEFDTGSFISIAPASLATILGVDLTTGPQIILTGVGGSQITAYVHQLTIQLQNDQYQNVDVAIANSEQVPYLLGRVNFWDLASVSIDNATRTLCITQLAPGAPGALTYPAPNDYLLPLGIYAVVAGILYFGHIY